MPRLILASAGVLTMAATLAERFSETKGGPIDWHGRRLRPMLEIQHVRAESLTIALVHAKSQPVQALRVVSDGGKFEVNGQRLEDVVLWWDHAPPVVTLHAHPNHAEMTVKVWNAWRDRTGTMQAWIGNAGIAVQSVESGIRLECSDGLGEVSLEDLIVTIERGSAQTSIHSDARQGPGRE